MRGDPSKAGFPKYCQFGKNDKIGLHSSLLKYGH